MDEFSPEPIVVAVGQNLVTGKRVLYVGLEEPALQRIVGGTPIHRPLDGSVPGDAPTPGMEGWELVLLGPASLPAFRAAIAASGAIEVDPA